MEPRDDDGTSWRKDVDKDRLKVGIKGAYLKLPFQCDNCWFVNIKDRRPTGSSQDMLLQVAIRRALLDVMWNFERSTIHHHVAVVSGIIKERNYLGDIPPLHELGP